MNGLANMAHGFGPLLLGMALAPPLALLAACLSRRLRRHALALLWLAPLPALAAALLVIGGAPSAFELPALQISLFLDTPGAMLLAVAALLWIAASITALAEMRGKPNAERFAVCWLLTLTGSLGVFIAADLLTFYLVYALVSIPAFGLIAHDGEAASRRAGGVFIAFTVLGEAFLLMGFVLLAVGEASGSVQIRDVMAALPSSPWRGTALLLVITGFGMKIGLVPLHGWMPLAYTVAPIPAAAVLSGAAVKAGVIGLIRFLPFDAAVQGWGDVLVAFGFISAFYGVAIGITQHDPKAVLAYSSISQMGVIAAVLGMGLSAADTGTMLDVAFYAAHHVLVKGALFLTVGVAAVTSGRRLWLVLLLALVLSLSLGGLPLTGGALAKLAVKAPLGDGTAGTLATISAAGTTLLMLHFLHRVARGSSQDVRAAATAWLTLPWLGMTLASLLIPWLLYPATGGTVADALTLSALNEALWPVLAGAALGPGLWLWGKRLPRVPVGDIVVAQEAAFRASYPLGAAFERMDLRLRQWPAAGLSLLTVALILAAAVSAR
ncbi:proton-conducting transporter membrane subunit [Methylocapsa sp. D3K7]|uniref:proton-conducting transporter transmembrane domain-containing protein n=1 Tax=Methylocapsa sp. D3K7 TaxID=3041435 RepID=UPI00244EC2B1|nr:proton-conducting transporter membrane subunit [Methylocapsa sp. D3K7]WGJ14306.1 proton-conducting transporter membrane subunit [Methylocapsa sp. D3K7]